MEGHCHNIPLDTNFDLIVFIAWSQEDVYFYLLSSLNRGYRTEARLGKTFTIVVDWL